MELLDWMRRIIRDVEDGKLELTEGSLENEIEESPDDHSGWVKFKPTGRLFIRLEARRKPTD